MSTKAYLKIANGFRLIAEGFEELAAVEEEADDLPAKRRSKKGKIRDVIRFAKEKGSINYAEARRITGWDTIPLPGILRDFGGLKIIADPAPRAKGVTWRVAH